MRETVLIDGSQGPLEVRKLVLQGSNEEIGRHLAAYARDHLAVKKEPWTDPIATRAQRAYLRAHWPQHYDRMRGVAKVFDMPLDDDALEFSFLYYDVGVPGCSCVFYPGSSVAGGSPLLARNFDFPIPTQGGMAIERGAQPMATRAFMIEAHPHRGYSSLYMCAFDLLGACMDGVNSEGLAVALLSDAETQSLGLAEPLNRNGVGLNEVQLPRFLLDTCATAAEARLALLQTQQFYSGLPNHYLIADRSGDAFVWEFSSRRNRHHVVEANGAPLAVTNHLIHPHERPTTQAIEESEARLGKLNAALAKPRCNDTMASVRRRNMKVEARTPVGQGQYQNSVMPSRTLWCAIYDLKRCAVDIDFYLGDDANGPRRLPVRRFEFTF